MPALLKIEGLTVSFPGNGKRNTVVQNISFHIEKGETLALVGESGSGKSVTALTIAGLLQGTRATVDSGEILFTPFKGSEKNLLKLKEKEYRRIRGNHISMIFQEPMTSLNPVMKCGNQVSEVIRLHKEKSKKEAKKMALELFDEVHLPRREEIYNSYPHEISGGQKQRVMIAMAIACRPDLLIADEPTTALDVTVQKNIVGLLRQIQRNYGMSVLFISHDLGVVAEIADHIAIMKDGRIVEKGNVGDIFINPEDPYTMGLLACRPRIDISLKRLPTVGDFIKGVKKEYYSEKAFKPSEKEEIRAARMKKEPVLEVRHLKTWFPGKKELIKAVNDVSFDVYPGETLGLVGESGCGKTTLGRTVLKLVDSTGGSVKYFGREILGNKNIGKAFRRSVQIIFQDPYSSLNPRISVGSQVAEPLVVHKLERNRMLVRERVNRLLEKVGLGGEYYYRYPHELSGGQRQRIGIARALAVSPDFIVCDESVSALDVSIQAQVLNLLNDLKAEFGFTFIFISHDLAVVKHMSDRILVMKDGEIVETGSSDSIFDSPQHEYTERLIRSVPGTH